MTDLTEEVARALFDGRPHNNWVKGIQQIPNWDLQPDHLKAVFRRDAQAAIAIVLERAAGVCGDQAKVFLSPEYATGQPLSSTQERFACMRCAEEILALSQCSEAKI